MMPGGRGSGKVERGKNGDGRTIAPELYVQKVQSTVAVGRVEIKHRFAVLENKARTKESRQRRHEVVTKSWMLFLKRQ
jgi:hypothetical protein